MFQVMSKDDDDDLVGRLVKRSYAIVPHVHYMWNNVTQHLLSYVAPLPSLELTLFHLLQNHRFS